MEVVNGKGFEPTCTIKMDKEVSKFDEFIMVAFDNNSGTHVMYHNADAITAGVALKMLAKSFADMMDALPEDIRGDVQEYLRRK